VCGAIVAGASRRTVGAASAATLGAVLPRTGMLVRVAPGASRWGTGRRFVAAEAAPTGMAGLRGAGVVGVLLDHTGGRGFSRWGADRLKPRPPVSLEGGAMGDARGGEDRERGAVLPAQGRDDRATRQSCPAQRLFQAMNSTPNTGRAVSV